MARLPRRAECRVGVSGWRYAGWRGDFYPRGLRIRDELAFLAARMTTVELNGSFYSLQLPSSYLTWSSQTPADFVFGVKGGRYITHLKRLVGVETALANYFASGVLLLGEKLGPVLWQLPARTSYDAAVMRDFLDLLPRTTKEAAVLAQLHNRPPERVAIPEGDDRPVRHAIEVRHRSFVDDTFFAMLAEHDVACAVSDAPDWPLIDEQVTDLVYARLHGHTELYASGYSGRSLDAWADRCRRWLGEDRDVFVYFDNDARGRAPHDALALTSRLSADR